MATNEASVEESEYEDEFVTASALDGILQREMSRMGQILIKETRNIIQEEMEGFRMQIRNAVREVTAEKVQEMKQEVKALSREEFVNWQEGFLKRMKTEIDISEQRIRGCVNQYVAECNVTLVHPSNINIISVVDNLTMPETDVKQSEEKMDESEAGPSTSQPSFPTNEAGSSRSEKDLDRSESVPSGEDGKIVTSTPKSAPRKIPRFNWGSNPRGNDFIVNKCKDNNYRRTISIKEAIFEEGAKKGFWSDSRAWYSRVITRIDNVCRNQ